jgi:hypothetical protein
MIAAEGLLETLSASLNNATGVLAGRSFKDVGDVVSTLEPFIGELQGLKNSTTPDVDPKAIHEVRKSLHRLNEVTAHLHLVHRGLVDIGRVSNGSYGPDGLMSATPSASLRGEG